MKNLIVQISNRIQIIGPMPSRVEAYSLEKLTFPNPKFEENEKYGDWQGETAEIQTAVDKVNELWEQAQGGRPVRADYCAAVENWKTMFIQAIEDEKRLSRLAQDGRSGRGKR